MTTVVASGPRVRVRAVPPCEPPLDDHRDGTWAVALTQPTLPLAGPAPRPVRPRPAPAPEGIDQATRSAAVRFVQTCLEIINGYRPLTHLRTMSHPLAAAQVLEAMTLATRRLVHATGGASPRNRIGLRRMRVCEPSRGVAEVAAVIGTAATAACGIRCWAVAFRLEHQQGRWQCTVARML